MGTVTLRVPEAARKAAIENPYSLSRATGLGYAICYRLWHGNQSRIDLTTIARLCDALNCQPGELMTYNKAAGKRVKK
jgi:DNA-binding Xre family transcriptional regulator